MQINILDNNYNKIDSYSALICANYFKTKQDYINFICVNSKFKETTEKFRYNPISIKTLKLFPKIQTQHLYKKGDKMLKRKQIIKYEIWYCMDYKEYTRYGKSNNFKCHNVEYTQKNRIKYGEEIPGCVTFLGACCFYGCTTLSTINLPTTLTRLGNGCFNECSTLSAIYLPTSLNSLGDCCFYECSTLSSIDLPSSLSSLSWRCFSGCSILSSINLPSSLTSLGDYCFSGCTTISTINLPTILQSLGRSCFSGCSTLSRINLPSSLKSIGEGCFSYCSTLSTINLPSSLQSFGNFCFYRCSQLKGVINVPDYCFDKPVWIP